MNDYYFKPDQIIEKIEVEVEVKKTETDLPSEVYV